MPRRPPGSSTADGTAAGKTEPRESAAERDPRAADEPRFPELGDVVPSLRDMLGPYVLLALSLQRAHGYMIEEYLNGLGFLNIQMSTLYRALRRLEREGLVSSSWESGEAGPARRVYTLTSLGRRFLDRWAGALKVYRGLLDRFFSLYSDGSAPATRARRGDPSPPLDDLHDKDKKDRKR